MKKYKVAVVGATGLAGQQFLAALDNHPWFDVTGLAASPRSAGKAYVDAIKNDGGMVQWFADGPLSPKFASIIVQDAKKLNAKDYDVIFTATESDAAKELEPVYAKDTPVISTASAFRYEDDVPLLLPGLNSDHAKLLKHQSEKRGWKGFVAPNPNCTTVGLAYALAPLYRNFGIERVDMVSMQAVSGAGRSPGVCSMDILDNIVPFIPKEEGKVETETQKILGAIVPGKINTASFPVSSTCTRVPVLEGHTEAVHVCLSREVTLREVTDSYEKTYSAFKSKELPTSPESLVVLHDDPYRPQVRLDRNVNNGLSTVIGRLRVEAGDARRVKLVLVSHNTKLGAAAGCILTAEELIHDGILS